MSKSIASPFLPEIVPAALSGPAAWLRIAGIVLAGSVFAALCAHIALPLIFTPVPLTLQPFAVLLLGLLLTPRLAGATFTVYLLEGAAGLPVFAPNAVAPGGGLAHLFGPTGGYLLAYPLAAMLISALWRRMGRGFASALLSAAAGDAMILACGALWLAILPHLSAKPAMALAVAPFLPGDALKVAAAAALAFGASRFRRSTRSAHPV
jgi:biotin transport system substrate-specific component